MSEYDNPWVNGAAGPPPNEAKGAGPPPSDEAKAAGPPPNEAKGAGPPPSEEAKGAGPPPTTRWAPPAEPSQWTAPQPEPPTYQFETSAGPTSQGHKASASLRQWLAVAAVSALIGGGVGAAANNGGSSTSASSSRTATTAERSAAVGLPATPSSIRGVLDKVQPAVVTIQVDEAGGGTGSGTGMIITPDGEILTNAHVVNGGSNIMVTLTNSKEPQPAKLLGMDPSIDSAVIKLQNASGLPTVQFGDSNAMQVGDQVVAIGNALALAGGPSVTTGIVSAKDRSIPEETGTVISGLIQTDAAINPGNSGGPLANMAGQVIGMNTAVIRGQTGEFQNIGFALAINTVQPAIADLAAGKIAQPAYLGVYPVTLDPDIRARYGLTPQAGAVVDTIEPGSPADKAGLSHLDVVTQFDGKDVTSADDLVGFVRSKHPGDKVPIVYYRGADKHTVTVTLTARPSSG